MTFTVMPCSPTSRARAGEADDSGLGRDVVCLALGCLEHGPGPVVHDAAPPAALHQGQERAAHQEHAGEVDVEDAPEAIGGQLLEGDERKVPRAVDQHVDVVGVCAGEGRELADVVLRRDVGRGGEQAGVGAVSAAQCRQRVLVGVGCDDGVVVLQEPLDEQCAYAARCSGDDYYPVVLHDLLFLVGLV
jgi:hypothetical protein